MIIFYPSDKDGTGPILALKSNICKESIYNVRFENIICIFKFKNKKLKNFKNKDIKRDKIVCPHLHFKNNSLLFCIYYGF